LSNNTDNKEPRIIQLVTFNTYTATCTFAHVHFSNSDTSAEAYPKETLTLLEHKDVSIIGDFNIKDLKKYSEIYTKKYSFQDLTCLQAEVSDHRIITATIKPIACV